MKESISGYTQLAGVIANPIKHSLSPMIHNKAYELEGVDAVYLAFEVTKENFNQAIESIKTFNMLGVNISMPYKRLALEACDELSKEAQLIGVVNTIILRDGQLVGYNTDGIGFIHSLKSQQVEVKNKSITVLGAGGAGKAVICQSALEGVKEINVFKRKNKTYYHVKEELEVISQQTGTLIRLFDYEDSQKMEEVIASSQIIVNSTQLGMGEDKSLPTPSMESITSQHVLVDLIYHPLETEWLKQGKEKEAKVINGLGMLVHQASYAFNLMTKKKMPVEKIEEFLKDTWQQ